MSKRITWHVETRKVSDLKPYDKNPRIITELGLNELQSSFDDIGYAQYININTDNTILSGHARCMVLKKEDPNQEIKVLVPDRKLTPKQEEAVLIRMNKNQAGAWDFDILANEFEMDDLMEWGFSENSFGIAESDGGPSSNKEIDLDNFGNDLEHTCPKCGFEFND